MKVTGQEEADMLLHDATPAGGKGAAGERCVCTLRGLNLLSNPCRKRLTGS